MFAGRGVERLAEAGYFTTPRSRSAYERIDAMGEDLRQAIRVHRPTHAVIELTSGKVGGRHGGRGAGLATYGVAVGALREVLRTELGAGVVTGVLENEWTRGVSKAKRLAWLRYRFPAYAEAAARDGGGDMGDAIGVGRVVVGDGREGP